MDTVLVERLLGDVSLMLVQPRPTVCADWTVFTVVAIFGVARYMAIFGVPRPLRRHGNLCTG